jgi:hypothetical protein
MAEALYNEFVILFQRIADGKERICDLGIQLLVGKFRDFCDSDFENFIECLFSRETPVQMLEYFFSNEHFVSCPILRYSEEYVTRYHDMTGDLRAVKVLADLRRHALVTPS